MNRRHALVLLGWLPGGLAAQDLTLDLEGWVRSGRDWLTGRVEAGVLEPLRGWDEAQTRQVLREVQRRLQGEHVLDLAGLRGTAQALPPVLERFPGTAPYAGWLRARLDYFTVAERLRVIVPRPRPAPGQPPGPPPRPTPEQERQVWREQVSKQPAPKGAAAYVPRLKPVFTAEKSPAALVWLAEVESSFNSQAVSPAGAAGLYQLMPATARSLGLSLEPEDERFDPVKNGRAAAKYLRHLHRRFRDWPLALAAYNCGEGRLQSLLTRHQARTFAEVAPRLPAETQMYVPKFEAVLARREGVALARLPAPAA